MGRAFLLIYSLVTFLLFPIFLAAILLHTLFRPHTLRSHLQRLSLLFPKKVPKTKMWVWIHAVSLGNVKFDSVLDTVNARIVKLLPEGLLEKNRGVSERIYSEIFNRIPDDSRADQEKNMHFVQGV